MSSRIDLTKYESMYNTFDGGHNKTHMKEVRNFAIKLGKKYCPDKSELLWVAATLHDVGLSVERENHELHSYELIKNDEIVKSVYSEREFDEILEAIKEHRASTGNPQGIAAKIVSDSDKVSDGTNRAFQRAYEWGKKHFPEINREGQLMRAAQHLYIKFGPGGSGTRLHFEESRKRQEETYKPIFEALDNNDLKGMEVFL